MDAPSDTESWRAQTPEFRARLRWRLLTDLHPTNPRPNQLTPASPYLPPLPPPGALDDELEALLECGQEDTVRKKLKLEPVEWDVVLYRAGRGWGKSRVGAEDVAHFALTNDNVRVALVARTTADGRDTMVEGESGLLSVIPESCLRGGSRDTAWNRSLGELILENGSRFDTYTAEKPGQLRGPQFHRAWVDEAAAYGDASLGDVQDTAWNNLRLAVRLGEDPKIVVTTTPKNNKLMREIIADPATITVTGSTYENLHNLAGAFKRRIMRYEGTRVGRQELHAEMLEEAEGALWTREVIEKHRVPRLGPVRLERVAVAIDPAVSTGPSSADTGIMIGGLSQGGCAWCGTRESHVFILEDRTCHEGPEGWGRTALSAFDDHAADLVVGEVNNGGDLVESNVRSLRRGVPFKQVRASRGKAIRAEPVSSAYARGVVHHVGGLPWLEDQMTTWEPNSNDDSPDRMDALVWLCWELLGIGDDVELPSVSRPRTRRQRSGWAA